MILPIFGCLFMLVGSVLTAASYRGCGANEEPEQYAERIAFTGNSRILGPVCIVAGALMTIAGITLCLLMRAAQRKQRRLAYHCPVHGDFYPSSPSHSSQYSRSLWCWLLGWLGMQEDGEIPRCPRSSENYSPSHGEEPCPSPMPFVVPSDSIVAMASILGAPISPGFGSIRSLAASREVASFPLSRSPTPPPLICPPYQEEVPEVDIPIPFPMSDMEYIYHAPDCQLSIANEMRRQAAIHGRPNNNAEEPTRTVTISIIPDDNI